MASQGPLSPSVAADDAGIGTVAWTGPGNVTASDDTYASANLAGGATEWSVKLVKGGVIGGTDHANPGALLPDADAYETFGSASDLWGLTLSAADVNASNFGVAVASRGQAGNTSHYVKATGFGFTVPAGSTVNGVVAEVEWAGHATNGSAFVDHVRLTAYYTPAVVVLARVFSESGYCARAQLGM